jgi:hypothetical protein
MSEDEGEGVPSVTEIAAWRYKSARDALERMQADLTTLSDKAIERLCEQGQASYSDLIASTNMRRWAPVDMTHQTANTWCIPETQFFLPNWREWRPGGDFFGHARSFEHTLVRKTGEGSGLMTFERFQLLTFEAFIMDCTQAEYVGVCKGLHNLVIANP